MSLQDFKISEDTVQQIYVQAQQDILIGTAQQNKAVFDALPLLIKDRLNAVLDALSGSGAAAQVPIQTVQGLTAGNMQQAIEEIKELFDAYEEKIQSSAGAAAVGVSTIDGVSGSNVQQALQSIKGLIDTIQAGTLPDGSVTSDLIADGAVTAQKIAGDAIVQLGALLSVAAAAAYDPEGSYAVGAYCTHGGGLHKCNTAIPDGEAWNAAHWTATTVAAEFAEVKTSLSNKVGNQAIFIPNNDCNDIADFGLYLVLDDTANGYNSTIGDLVINAPWDANTMFQLYLSTPTQKILWRAKTNMPENPWSGWFPLANATPPQEHAIVPKNGATLIDGMKNVFSKDQFGKLELHVGMNFSSFPAKGTEIFSLPQSFAPVGGIVAGAMILSMGTACYPAFLTVNTDGAVVLQHNVTDYSGQIDLFGFMCFGTGGTQ